MKYEAQGWKVIRWILILPCAFLASIFVKVICGYVWIIFVDRDSWILKYFGGFSIFFTSGFVFMLVGIKIVPSHYKTAAIVLLCIIIFLNLLDCYYDIMQQRYYRPSEDLFSILGSFIGYFFVRRKKDRVTQKNT